MNIFELLRVPCSLTIHLTRCWLREIDTIFTLYIHCLSYYFLFYSVSVCVCVRVRACVFKLLQLLLLILLSLLFMIITYVITLSPSFTLTTAQNMQNALNIQILL